MRTLRLRQTVLSSTTTAIVRLNYTINNYGQSANLDTQIWLTATLTNLETCRTSCIELDVRDYRPLLSINVFNLINTGEVTLKKTTYHINRRKKLEATHVGSTSLLANLLVARDGSGDFKKIKKAVNVGNFLLAISLQVILCCHPPACLMIRICGNSVEWNHERKNELFLYGLYFWMLFHYN
jgi:pectinesterase